MIEEGALNDMFFNEYTHHKEAIAIIRTKWHIIKFFRKRKSVRLNRRKAYKYS